MSITRHYFMTAADGKAEVLEQALGELARSVRALPGSLGVELLKDHETAGRFVFLEHWESIEAHGAAGKALPKPVMSAVVEALSGRPEGCYLDPLLSV